MMLDSNDLPKQEKPQNDTPSNQMGDVPVPGKAAKANLSKQPGKSEIYGSFTIDESEFAIPVSAVQEVVNEPMDISPVPLSPSFMLGLFNLRGKIIPVIDLRCLLEFPELEGTISRKVAIIEHGDLCIGLLFDKTGEVLSGYDAARVDFQPKGDGIKDVVIEGVLKFDNGDRLVQVLDPYELLNLERVPRTNNISTESQAKASRGKRYNCISFQTGHTCCALDLRYVKEIREMPDVDQSLFAHGNVIGTTNLRGVILPVVDFRGFMGDGAVYRLGQTVPKERKMLVIETADGPIGLMVFSIDNIMSYYEDEILPFAKLALPRSDFVSGCLVNSSGQIVMMLDQDRLRTDELLVATAKACQEIYPPGGPKEEQEEKQAKGAARRTYIRFSIAKPFALETSCVSEVINKPDTLLDPPYKLDFVEGIINLRRELITLLNPRVLYGMPAEEMQNQKVLIFNCEDTKYGILVDSVDEIIMTTEDKIAALQPMDRQGTTRRVVDDVVGCLHHEVSGDKSTPILVLDPGALVDRCMRSIEGV